MRKNINNVARRRAVFFDRDGVLNKAILQKGRVYAPLTLREFIVEPKAAEVVAQLHRAGFLAIVVTNQPEIARGQLSWSTLRAMHRHLTSIVPLDAIYVCPHDSAENCDCRKPKPGLLHQSARDWKIDLSTSYLIGDRSCDIRAGLKAGSYTILIERTYNLNVAANFRTRDLRSAARHILTLKRQKKCLRNIFF